jgi:CxxC motif-containing protein (DUF1111 family)
VGRRPLSNALPDRRVRLVSHGLRAGICALALLAAGNAEVVDPAALSAGPWTTTASDRLAYSMPAAPLDAEQAARFAEGREQFHEAWVVAPEPAGVWGLGPTFNEDRCAGCHADNGRSRTPADRGEAARGPLLRLSLPGSGEHGAPIPHPHYGDQLQNRGIAGRVPAEGRAIVTWVTHQVAFADGETAELRKPQIELRDMQFGELGADTLVSLRIAPQLIGLGLLEAVPEQTILKIAETQRARGIAGKPNYVWDVEEEHMALGRFGWKANQPSLRQQTAAAFIGDIGATTYLFQSENCPAVQTACIDTPSAASCGGQGGCGGNTFRPEVNPSRLKGITLYLQALAVPARRNMHDPAVRRGERLFAAAQCDGCHVPELKTGPDAALAAASNLTIRPYTDLLLHDMGEALADGRPDFAASGSEWRTPPLWGIGLLPAVSGHSDLLHDGRARNVTEAILWHGGQAEPAREAFRAMPKPDREALVRFVESL